jgi:hypothetical protein
MVVLMRCCPRLSVWTAKRLALASIAGVALGACASKDQQAADAANGTDPIAALDAPTESTRYGTAYWTQQADSNTTTWQRAKDYCARSGVTAQGQKVNCAPVMAARFEETARHPERRAPGTLRP